MKMRNRSMVLFGIAFGLLLALSVQAAPLVSNVVGAQRAGTKLVDITYDLADDDHATLSVTIKISQDAGATWDVPCTSLSGDGIGPEVAPGKGKSIVWDAGADWNGQWSDQMLVEVTAAINAAPPPARGEWLVVDLSDGPNARRYPVSYLDNAPGGPWPVAGWSDKYKTTKLVLRKIPAGTFMMGSPADELGRNPGGGENETLHQVTLTKDFYVGVFEVTQKQWELVMGTRPSTFSNEACYAARPVENVSYEDIRGSDLGSGWPANNAVDGYSFLGRLRAKTGLDFDLPTEAQWEYACRAGTTTALNSGKNLTATEDCVNMAEVGRYKFNGGLNHDANADTTGGTAAAGSYQPNAWELYDMHGNVLEWCLDWYDFADYPHEAVTDPVGVNTPPGSHGPCRTARGGSRTRSANCCRSTYREPWASSKQLDIIGFRVVKTIQ